MQLNACRVARRNLSSDDRQHAISAAFRGSKERLRAIWRKLRSRLTPISSRSDVELRRLMLQAAILKPITRRLLLEAGLRPGMRVLDIGP